MILGAAVEAALWATVFIGYFHAADATPSQLAFALVVSVAAGLIVVGLTARRLTVWLGFLLAGLLIGVSSAAELLFSEPFEQEFFVAIITLAYFAALGLAFGMLFEFVRLLHFLLHGGKIRGYQTKKLRS